MPEVAEGVPDAVGARRSVRDTLLGNGGVTRDQDDAGLV